MGGTSTIPRPRLSLANARHCNAPHTILFQVTIGWLEIEGRSYSMVTTRVIGKALNLCG